MSSSLSDPAANALEATDAAIVPVHEKPSSDTAVVSVPSFEVNGKSYAANDLKLPMIVAEVEAGIEKEFTEDPKGFAREKAQQIKNVYLFLEAEADDKRDQLLGVRQEVKEMNDRHAEELAALELKALELKAKQELERETVKARDGAAFEAYDTTLQSLIPAHGVVKFTKGVFKCAQKNAKDRKGDMKALHDENAKLKAKYNSSETRANYYAEQLMKKE